MNDPKFFCAFGLNIASDLPLPELLPGDADRPVDLRVEENGADDPTAALHFTLRVRTIGEFRMEEGRRLTYRRAAGVTDADVRLFLLGSALGCVLQQRGYVVLHGNAISSDDKTSTIFVGKTGAGKSTAAAYHFIKGARVLADDVCAVTFDSAGNAHTIPSFPRLKLWQTSADLLGIPTSDLERIRVGFDKYSLPLGPSFGRAPLRLTDIVEILPAGSEETRYSGVDKLRPLIEHSYRHHFLAPMKLSRAYTKKLVQLAGCVEVRRAPRIVLA